jgi:hypothetical protein
MKRLIKNTSPFLLLIIPFLVAVLFMALQSGTEMIQERVQLSASVIQLPEFNIFQVFTFLW